jgi:hypothetical protein
MAVLVGLGLVQSSWLASRGFRHVDWPRLFRLILPSAAAGLAVGIGIRDLVNGRWLSVLFGVFVTIFSMIELDSLRKKAVRAPLPAKGVPYLVAGGVVHGLFATGGPLVVYYAGRAIHSRAVFRSTLAILWLVLNIVLLTQLSLAGTYTMATLKSSAFLLPAALFGITLGEWMPVADEAFHKPTFALLAITGLALVIRGLQ